MPNHFNYSQFHWIPANCVFLATSIKGAGMSPRIVDDRIQPRDLTKNRLSELLPESLAVLISAASGSQLLNAIQIASWVKEQYPGVPVIFGGPFPSAEPELTLTSSLIDFVIAGQGEFSATELCKGLLNGNLNPNRIPNLYFRKDSGEIAVSSAPQENFDINDLPDLLYFDREVIQLENYINPETRAINYSTSTGCVGSCTFCYWHPDYRPSCFRVDRVLRDLKRFREELNIWNINFDDPTFFVKPSRILEIVNGIRNSLSGVHWRANGRIDTMSAFPSEYYDLIKSSGCDLVHIGLESGSPRILKLMQKNICLEDTLKLIRETKRTGIRSRFHVLLGIPTETIEDLKMTANFIRRLQLEDRELDYTVNFFTPYPGNYLTRLALENGYQAPVSIEECCSLMFTNYKHIPEDDRMILKETSPWKEDFLIPWFSPEFTKEYFQVFRELFPEKNEILTTGGKMENIFS